jgi:hypothetical protein
VIFENNFHAGGGERRSGLKSALLPIALTRIGSPGRGVHAASTFIAAERMENSFAKSLHSQLLTLN